MRVYVIYGQGDAMTSGGMVALAARIRTKWPAAKVTEHVFRTGIVEIVPDIKKLAPDAAVVLIGYSLGANDVTMIGNRIGSRAVDLAVCYDPSVAGVVEPPGPNIKRLLLYHNNSADPIGHLIFNGPQVERTEIAMPHLSVCYSEDLHALTLAAVAKVAA